jgi:cytochrome bd ubiquinol oxidase subunit II
MGCCVDRTTLVRNLHHRRHGLDHAGSLWVQLKSGGAVQQRSGALAGRSWWVVVVLTALVTVVTFRVQAQILSNFSPWPLGWILPVLAIAGLAGVKLFLARRQEMRAFLSSCAYLLGMLSSVVLAVYPMVLSARDGVHSLTVAAAAAYPYGLKIGLAWWSVGMLLAAGYFTMLYRSFADKSLEGELVGHG